MTGTLFIEGKKLDFAERDKCKPVLMRMYYIVIEVAVTMMPVKDLASRD
jgi:hypothetical protein